MKVIYCETQDILDKMLDRQRAYVDGERADALGLADLLDEQGYDSKVVRESIELRDKSYCETEFRLLESAS